MNVDVSMNKLYKSTLHNMYICVHLWLLFLHLKHRREWMTFPATDLRFRNGAIRLLAKGRDPHTPLKDSAQRTRHRSLQFQKLTSIGLQDRWNRARVTEVCRPFLARCLKQAAFFHVAAAKIVAVEIFTFFASRSTHNDLRFQLAG